MKTLQTSIPLLALLGMLATPQAVTAKPPVPMTQAELAAIQADAASRADVLREKADAARSAIQTDLADSSTASRAAATFLVQADLPPVKTDDHSAAEPKPLEIPDHPDNTIISCDGGIYFDPDDGVLVYLKNVTIKDPRFTMTGANEVKVFFEKKAPDPEKKAPEGKNKKTDKGIAGDIGKNIGEVERIIATGVLMIDQKPADGEDPIQASGAVFTYNVKAGVATLSGGFPWVKQGNRFLSSKKADNLLRIYPDEGRVDTTSGGWNMGLPIPQKDKAR